MKITNVHNLPTPMANALQYDPYYQDGAISVTGLIQPPRIRQLSKRYQGSITEDVSDRIWALLGSAVHYILEKAGTDTGISEQRLSCEVEGWKITGQADLWEPPGTLSDYKVTSAWAVLDRKPKPDWETQLNLYAHLYRLSGVVVDKLQVVAILRDWSKMKALQDNYPKAPVVTVPVNIWDTLDIDDYLRVRVLLHKVEETTADDDLIYCTPEERWERPTKYAVTKKGNKRATKLFDSDDGANTMCAEVSERTGKEHIVDVRPGESVRCEGYCSVKDFCNQYDLMKGE